MWTLIDSIKSDGKPVGYSFMSDDGDMQEVSYSQALKLIGSGQVRNAKLYITSKRTWIQMIEGYEPNINNKNQLQVKSLDSLEGQISPGEAAWKYLQKYQMVGKEPPLDIEILSDNDVILNRVREQDLIGELVIPWFITGFKKVTDVKGMSFQTISRDDTVLGGSLFTRIVINNSPDRPIYLNYLCSRMRSERIELIVRHPDKVMGIQNLFEGCENVRIIIMPDIQFKYGQTDGMFQQCFELKEIQFGSNAMIVPVQTNEMFMGCRKLKNIDSIQQHFIFSAVKQAIAMFRGCNNLRRIDLQALAFTNLANAEQMFSHCQKLETITSKPVAFGYLRTAKHMFQMCSSLRQFDFGKIKMPNVKYIDSMLIQCDKLEKVSFYNQTMNELITADQLCYQCRQLKTVEFEHQSFQKLQFMRSAFQGNNQLQTLDFKDTYMPKLQDIQNILQGCSCLEWVDFARATINSLANIQSQFEHSQNLKAVRFPKQANKIEQATFAFQLCKQFMILEAPGFDMREANVDRMFDGCKRPIKLDIASKEISRAIVEYAQITVKILGVKVIG